MQIYKKSLRNANFSTFFFSAHGAECKFPVNQRNYVTCMCVVVALLQQSALQLHERKILYSSQRTAPPIADGLALTTCMTSCLAIFLSCPMNSSILLRLHDVLAMSMLSPNLL